jgi:hypothetical protein
MNEFKPSWWAKNAHLQTLSAHFLRSYKAASLQRVRLKTPDDDFVDYDFLQGEKHLPLVVLLHGLEGSSHSRYIKAMLGAIADLKWNAIALNHRGCSGELNRSKTTYHSGKTEDLDFILKEVVSGRYPKVFVIGYSIGGNILLKYLGESTNNNSYLINKAAL